MRTVRTKLLVVVVICLLPSFLATTIISLIFERSQRDAARAGMAAAQAAFLTELRDDISDLQVAVQLLGTDPDVHRELLAKDRETLLEHIDDFTLVYPEMRVLLASVDGQVLATTDPALAGDHLPLPVADFRGVTLLPHADGSRDHVFSYALIRPVVREGQVAGLALAAFPLNSTYLANTAQKTGLALAFRNHGEILGRTSNTAVLEQSLPGEPQILRDAAGGVFAVMAFSPQELTPLEVVAALDLTQATHALALAFRERLLTLLGIAILAVAFAWRLSSRMAQAVKTLARALPGIAEQRFVPVQLVRTNDELETLGEVYNQMVARILAGERWRSALGKYLSPAAQRAVESGEVHLGGSVMSATVLFSDIRSFTALSEHLPPERVLELLNRYFTEMVAAVTRHGGTVDKFIGDCVMAVWGPPSPKDSDPLNAVRAGLAMREALAALNQSFERDHLPTLRTGIGIHTGAVVAGNLGSEGVDGHGGRMEYTVIGDTVNLASRLEALTKELHTDFVISESTYHLVREEVDVEPLASVTVRGRTEPVAVYRVLRLRDPAVAG